MEIYQAGTVAGLFWIAAAMATLQLRERWLRYSGSFIQAIYGIAIIDVSRSIDLIPVGLIMFALVGMPLWIIILLLTLPSER